MRSRYWMYPLLWTEGKSGIPRSCTSKEAWSSLLQNHSGTAHVLLSNLYHFCVGNF